MGNGRRLTIGLALLATAVPLLYVVGYFWACLYVPYADARGLHAIDRIYPRHWQMVIFEPASKVETYVRRIDVYVSVGYRTEADV